MFTIVYRVANASSRRKIAIFEVDVSIDSNFHRSNTLVSRSTDYESIQLFRLVAHILFCDNFVVSSQPLTSQSVVFLILFCFSLTLSCVLCNRECNFFFGRLSLCTWKSGLRTMPLVGTLNSFLWGDIKEKGAVDAVDAVQGWSALSFFRRRRCTAALRDCRNEKKTHFVSFREVFHLSLAWYMSWIVVHRSIKYLRTKSLLGWGSPRSLRNYLT